MATTVTHAHVTYGTFNAGGEKKTKRNENRRNNNDNIQYIIIIIFASETRKITPRLE